MQEVRDAEAQRPSHVHHKLCSTSSCRWLRLIRRHRCAPAGARTLHSPPRSNVLRVSVNGSTRGRKPSRCIMVFGIAQSKARAAQGWWLSQWRSFGKWQLLLAVHHWNVDARRCAGVGLVWLQHPDGFDRPSAWLSRGCDGESLRPAEHWSLQLPRHSWKVWRFGACLYFLFFFGLVSGCLECLSSRG